MLAKTPARQTSDERRAQVLDAAVVEFAMHGYHAARTASIAKRAGISQPYVYALFPNKKALFLSCYQQVMNRTRDAFTEAARGAADPDDALERMGIAYCGLLEDRDELLCQLQGYAAAGDPEIRDEVRRHFGELFAHVQSIAGSDRASTTRFFANGMLLNVAAALDLPNPLESPLQ